MKIVKIQFDLVPLCSLLWSKKDLDLGKNQPIWIVVIVPTKLDTHRILNITIVFFLMMKRKKLLSQGLIGV